MQSLGSHRDRASEHGVEIHRRLFWTCYILDKLLGVERAFSLLYECCMRLKSPIPFSRAPVDDSPK